MEIPLEEKYKSLERSFQIVAQDFGKVLLELKEAQLELKIAQEYIQDLALSRPKEEPQDPESSNSGDSYEYGYDSCMWSTGNDAAEVLEKMKEASVLMTRIFAK